MLRISAMHTTATVIQGARDAVRSGVIRGMGVSVSVALWLRVARGKEYFELRAAPGAVTGRRNRPAMHLDQVARQRQPESQTCGSLATAFPLPEPLKHQRQIVVRNSGASILNGHTDVVLEMLGCDGNRSAGRRELHGIGK